jgi:hypothetical protein
MLFSAGPMVVSESLTHTPTVTNGDTDDLLDAIVLDPFQFNQAPKLASELYVAQLAADNLRNSLLSLEGLSVFGAMSVTNRNLFLSILPRE